MAALGWQKAVLYGVSIVLSGGCYVGLQHHDDLEGRVQIELCDNPFYLFQYCFYATICNVLSLYYNCQLLSPCHHVVRWLYGFYVLLKDTFDICLTKNSNIDVALFLTAWCQPYFGGILFMRVFFVMIVILADISFLVYATVYMNWFVFTIVCGMCKGSAASGWQKGDGNMEMTSWGWQCRDGIVGTAVHAWMWCFLLNLFFGLICGNFLTAIVPNKCDILIIFLFLLM